MKVIELAPGLTLRIKEDGTWLGFKSGNKQASVRLESMADDRGGIIGAAIHKWCQDTQKE